MQYLSIEGIIFVAGNPIMPTILIADDDEGIRDILQVLLEKEGYILDIKSRGDDLLINNFSIPDLFILDRQLLNIDGLDICKHLKRRPETASIPIIMISASLGIDTLSQQAGADNYLEKPFDINCLLEMIHNLINKQKMTA